MLAVVLPRDLADPDRAFQSAVANALAASADDRLLEVALAQYPSTRRRSPSPTASWICSASSSRGSGPRSCRSSRPTRVRSQAPMHCSSPVRPGSRSGAAGRRAARPCPAHLGRARVDCSAQDARGGQRLRGQWEITAAGEARRVPSRMITLAGPELIGGLTALERDLIGERPIDWQTYGLAAVDLAAIASGVALLRFAGTAARGASAARLHGGADAPIGRSCRRPGSGRQRDQVRRTDRLGRADGPAPRRIHALSLGARGTLGIPGILARGRLEHRANAARVPAHLGGVFRPAAPFCRLALCRVRAGLPALAGAGQRRSGCVAPRRPSPPVAHKNNDGSARI